MTNKKQNPEDDKSYLKSHKGEEILNIVQKGAEFTHELLKDNERLRFRVAQLSEENEAIQKISTGEAAVDDVLQKLQEKLKDLEEEKAKLLKSYMAVEEENKDFANRYIEIETENNNLANLYVASYQLHSTLNFNEVLRIILEIVINLIGAEEFAILLLDEKTKKLSAVASEGIETNQVPPIDLGHGPIGGSVKSGENFFKDNIAERGNFDPTDPIVAIPMKIKERAIGAIVIYKLLQQKESFTQLDYELFTLLAGHTATAIFSSKLYTESERKLSTVQGFIDLLTK